jgi:hypothetical protein
VEQLKLDLGDEAPDEFISGQDALPLGYYDDDGNPIVDAFSDEPTDVPEGYVRDHQ